MISDFTSEIWVEGVAKPCSRSVPCASPGPEGGGRRGWAKPTTRSALPQERPPQATGGRAQSGGEAAAPGPRSRSGGRTTGAGERSPERRSTTEDDRRTGKAATATDRRGLCPQTAESRPSAARRRAGEGQRQGKRRRARPTTTEGRDRRGHSWAAPPPAAGRAQTPGRPPEEARHLHHRRAISARDGAARRRGTARRPQAAEALQIVCRLWRQTSGRRGPTEEARGRRRATAAGVGRRRQELTRAAALGGAVRPRFPAQLLLLDIGTEFRQDSMADDLEFWRKSSADVHHCARLKTYFDGSAELMVCSKPVFIEAGYESAAKFN